MTDIDAALREEDMHIYSCGNCGGTLSGPDVYRCPYCGVLLRGTREVTEEEVRLRRQRERRRNRPETMRAASKRFERHLDNIGWLGSSC
jgi:DNA-directed RNA polymerase subunit RPC12/RpoP